MSFVEIFNCIANLSLFGLLLWRRPRLPAFWVWQVASVVAIGVVACTRNTEGYAGAWWLIAMALMVLEFAAAVELSMKRITLVNEIAILLMVAHLVAKSTEHYFWRDDPVFAWQMRHIAVALNEIIGGYLLLVLFRYPKEKSYVLRRREEASQASQAC